MYKNKSLNLILLLTLFCGCGLNTGGENLGSIMSMTQEDTYFQNSNGTLKLLLARNTDFHKGKYSRLTFTVKVPYRVPKDILNLPDMVFALKIQEFNPGPPSKQLKPDEEPPLLQTLILTFGDLSHAKNFLSPQEEDEPGRVALTNLKRENGLWDYNPLYKEYFKDELKMSVPKFFYSINNIYGGCAINCYGATAILPEETTDPRVVQYQFMIWVPDSESPKELKVDRSYTNLIVDLGYIDINGNFKYFDEDLIGQMRVEFISPETEYYYKKRIQKEKNTVLDETGTGNDVNKFLSNLTSK